eukprot:1701163-Rhodomonas_salina.1
MVSSADTSAHAPRPDHVAGAVKHCSDAAEAVAALLSSDHDAVTRSLASCCDSDMLQIGGHRCWDSSCHSEARIAPENKAICAGVPL